MKTPEQQSELRACPCCGTKILNVYATSGWFKIQCSACGLVMVRDLEIDNADIKAILGWNTRPTSAAELVAKAELKAWISARDLQDFKDYQDEARNSSFSISTFKTLNDDVEITISIVEAEVGK